NSIWFVSASDPDKVTAVLPDLEEFRHHILFLKPKKIDYLALSYPRFSPDGKSLMFRWGGLYLMDLVSKKTKLITNFELPFEQEQGPIDLPSFSPDGKQIAFVLDESGPYFKSTPGIYVINTDGSNLHKIN